MIEILHPDAISLFTHQDILYPPFVPTNKVKKVKLDEFLNTPLGFALKSKMTVRDIIKYEANVKGGVHLGKPRTDVEKDINEVIYYVGGFRFTLRQLISIAKVTIDGLQQLYVKLIEIENGKGIG